MSGLNAARSATVRVCDRDRISKGQGLLLDLGAGKGFVVLAPFHVVVDLLKQGLWIIICEGDGEGSHLPAQYDGIASSPDRDAAVLRLSDGTLAPGTASAQEDRPEHLQRQVMGDRNIVPTA